MDEAKWELLFGAAGDEPPGRVDDLEELTHLDELDDDELASRLLDTWGFLHDDADIGDVVAGGVATIVGKQILAEDPPEVWAAAQRLLALGCSRRQVVVQLTLALVDPLREVVDEGQPFDGDWYRERLAWLPVPLWAEVEEAVVTVVTRDQGITLDDLRDRVRAELLPEADDSVAEHPVDQVVEEFLEPLLDRVLDELFSLDHGVLLFMAGDRVVHLPSLFGPDVVLTTVVGPLSAAAGVLHAATDLPVFARRADVTVGGVPLDRCTEDVDDLAWEGPEGWLDGLDDQVVAVRVGEDGAVSLDLVDPWPALDDEFVASAREAYDALVDDGHPTGVLDVAAELALRHPGVFGELRPPLGDVLTEAGLETRGGLVAHSDAQWAASALTRGLIDDLYELEDRASQDASRRLRVALARPAERDDETLRDLLGALDGCGSTFLVVERVLVPNGVAADGAAELAEALVGAARRPAHQARAHWVAALVAEAGGDLSAAEAHLEQGVRADRGALEVVDRLAWYRSDRGDAAGALRLWRSIGRTPENHHEVKVVAATTAPAGADGPKLGRNDPCWCGSGRKYKQCHLGQAAQPALADRVRWLYAKAEGHLRRGGRGGVDEVMALGSVLVGDEADGDVQALLDAMDHPLVFGLAIEHGGLDAFLRDRGELLPEDEQLLAASWLPTSRSVHEVGEVRAGDGVTLRDLRRGEVHDVHDVAFSAQARPGQLVLGWVVPDGDRHQLLPGAAFVDPSSVDYLLALLDDGDAEGLLTWLRIRSQPPRLATTDGEPVVLCVAELDVEDLDPVAVREVLDGRYRSEAAAGGDPNVWHDLGAASADPGDGRSIRARLELDEELGVLLVEAHSESRLDAVLDALTDALPGVSVLTDRRTPVDLGGAHGGLAGPGGRGGLGGLGAGAPASGLSLPPQPVAPEVRAAVEAHIARAEEQWCDESVPALGGATPREAAADPIGRESLVRLIASFPEPDPDGPAMGLRPARLRALLGLDA